MDKKTLLVVDDDQDLLRGLNVRLKASGYEVTYATDGVQAISAARKTKPDLILLDIGLPAGDGFLVMDRLKSMGGVSAPIIIVLSARDPLVNRDKAIQAGAAAFLQKPVDNAILLAVIDNALREPVKRRG